MRNSDDGHDLIHTRHLKEIVIADSDPEGSIFDNPSELNSRYADIIIGFNHLEDELLLDQEVFDIDDSFKVKKTKIKSSPEESKASTIGKEFIYDKKLGGLYFKANGSEPGFGEDGGLIAEINGLKELKPWQISNVIELY